MYKLIHCVITEGTSSADLTCEITSEVKNNVVYMHSCGIMFFMFTENIPSVLV